MLWQQFSRVTLPSGSGNARLGHKSERGKEVNMEGVRLTLAQYRRLKGISAAEMARHLGVTRQTYYKYEADPEGLTIRQAQSIAEMMDVRFEDILFLPEPLSNC